MRILITGITGFVGSHLADYILQNHPEVEIFGLKRWRSPLENIEHIESKVTLYDCDLRDLSSLIYLLREVTPEVVFHLAAQPIVLHSFDQPQETFSVNVGGTVNLLEASRNNDFIKAIVIVTTDKVYENREWVWGYRETDSVGGYDPYSASKGCAELVTASYRKSFFPLDNYQKSHQTLVVSVRAGNVIGGGDWGDDRLVPDIMCAASQNERAKIRNPQATRPWQHVLEPLSGYLHLGQLLLEGKQEFSGAWNFGPTDEGHRNVLAVVRELQKHWSNIDCQVETDKKNPHEANLLKLDCSKAYAKLKWKSVWDSFDTFAKTAQWYRMYYESGHALSEEQLTEYITDAKRKQISWAVQ